MTEHPLPTAPHPISPRATASLRDYLELVKFSHTLFALPFALGGMLLAAWGIPQWQVIGWILVAMVGARTSAMGFNRIVDREIDARNPRTKGREIPAGKVSVRGAMVLVIVSSLLFAFAASRLNALAGWLSLPTLAALWCYSYCKRFTSFAHFVLGFCLGIAPIGAWIAVQGALAWSPVVLGAAVMLWVAGFDIIYATMDDEFDREEGLHSMVQRLGIPRALSFARVLHLAFILLLVLMGALLHLSGLFYAGVAGIAAFLAYEHAIVSPKDLRRVNAAFFTVNGAIAVFFLLLTALEVGLHRR